MWILSREAIGAGRGRGGRRARAVWWGLAALALSGCQEVPERAPKPVALPAKRPPLPASDLAVRATALLKEGGGEATLGANPCGTEATTLEVMPRANGRWCVRCEVALLTPAVADAWFREAKSKLSAVGGPWRVDGEGGQRRLRGKLLAGEVVVRLHAVDQTLFGEIRLSRAGKAPKVVAANTNGKPTDTAKTGSSEAGASEAGSVDGSNPADTASEGALRDVMLRMVAAAAEDFAPLRSARRQHTPLGEPRFGLKKGRCGPGADGVVIHRTAHYGGWAARCRWPRAGEALFDRLRGVMESIPSVAAGPERVHSPQRPRRAEAFVGQTRLVLDLERDGQTQRVELWVVAEGAGTP